jgi:FkbM family methyltransferase
LVDANPICCRSAEEMLSANGFGQRAKVRCALVGPEGEQMSFFQSKSSVRSSLFRPASEEKVSLYTTRSLAGLLQTDNIKNRDLVKIDIEGAESFLFQGQTEALLEFRFGLAEWHGPHWTGPQMRDWLEKNNLKTLNVTAAGWPPPKLDDPYDAQLGMVLWENPNYRSAT